MWPDLPRPTVFAHRGASAHAPENTLAAFRLAVQLGAPAIELDAKLSADGEVVVIHDAMVDRTTDGSGRVCDLPHTALRTLEAGAWFSGQFRGERIPTLGEVFETVGRQVFVNIELTNYTTPRDALVEKVIELVKAFNLQKNVLFSSFFPHNLKRAASLLPETPCGLLAWAGLPGWWPRSFGFAFGSYQALHPNLADVTARQAARVHRLKRRIHVWTVNAEADIRRLAAWGVDGIFCDDPALALRVLEANA